MRRKRRRATLKFWILLAIIIVLCAGGVTVKVFGDSLTYKWSPVLVEEGDRVWNYAKACQQNGIKEDIRRIVYDIEKYNGINAGYIKEGQVIYVPQPLVND